MNLSFGNTVPTIGRQINWKLVALAGGLAIAVSAATGIAVLDRGGQQAATPATAPVASGVVPADFTGLGSTTRPTIYVVDSQQQANQLRANLATEQASTGSVSDAQFHVVAGDAAGQTLHQAIAEDVANGGVGSEVIYVPSTSLSRSSSQVPDFGGMAETAPRDVYVVGSKAEASTLRASFAADGAEFEPSVVVVSENDAAAYEALTAAEKEDLANGGTGVKLIDLR